MRAVMPAAPGEVDRLRRRIGRALGAQQIQTEDHDYIRQRLDEISDRLHEMEERENGAA
jgi:hypothetical protein